ncbi:MAG: YceI family protein [Deltaproteobacteria bacterium]|nr:MAG: YceI family protein [Deltaproteobacteria bacterium]
MKRIRLIVTLLVAFAGSALGEEPDQVLVTYEAAVGERRISGASHSLHWSANQLADDRAQVYLRVPSASFDSGHAGFDSLLRSDWFEGTLTVHGVSRPLAVPIAIARAGTQFVARTSFAIDLDQFRIAVPSVGNHITVDFVARLSANPRAVIAGGALSSN